MRLRTKLWLMGSIPVAVNIAVVGFCAWTQNEWRPLVTVLAVYAVILAVMLVLAHFDETRRKRRRQRSAPSREPGI
ncbi:MAG: hypothetical protein KF861_21125 [Planctomycetaceae bacterium]|nr:hypothetical protein [Planctomycetaceae bacterium]